MSIHPPVLPTAATYAVGTPVVPVGKAPIAPPWAKGPAVAPANIGSAVLPAVPAVPACATCSDHGAVGNAITAQPCPDCTPARPVAAIGAGLAQAQALSEAGLANDAVLPADACPDEGCPEHGTQHGHDGPVAMVDFTALLEAARKQAAAAVQAQEVLAAKVREHQALVAAHVEADTAKLGTHANAGAQVAAYEYLQSVPAVRANWSHCTLSRGCDEMGACYAASQGQPSMCGAEPEVTTQAEQEDSPAAALAAEIEAEGGKVAAPVGAQRGSNAVGYHTEGAQAVFNPADFELLETDNSPKVPHEIHVQTRIVGGTRMHVTMQGYALRPAEPTGKRGRPPNPTRVMGPVEMYHLDIAEGFNVGMVQLLERYMERCYGEALQEVRENVKLGVLWAEPTYTLRQTTRPDLMLWQLQQGAMAVGMVQ